MLDMVLEILLLLMGLYGIISLIFSAVDTVQRKSLADDKNVRLAILVKDREEAIEGIVRSLLSRDIPGGKLTIIDMGSEDKTLNILQKLKRSFENITVLKYDERERLMGEFGESEEEGENHGT